MKTMNFIDKDIFDLIPKSVLSRKLTLACFSEIIIEDGILKKVRKLKYLRKEGKKLSNKTLLEIIDDFDGVIKISQ
jgi:hypothetical protein